MFGASDLALGDETPDQAGSGQGVTGRVGQGALCMGHCAVGRAFLQRETRQVQLRGRRSRIETKHLVEGGDRLRALAKPHLQRAQGIVRCDRVRVGLHRGLRAVSGFRELVFGLQEIGLQQEGSGIAWIAFDGSVHQAVSARFVVLRIRDRSKPRFRLPGGGGRFRQWLQHADRVVVPANGGVVVGQLKCGLRNAGIGDRLEIGFGLGDAAGAHVQDGQRVVRQDVLRIHLQSTFQRRFGRAHVASGPLEVRQ